MADKITIQLDALDTLFFKDGKPFSLGEETWADGIFPPPPSVVYGATRTALISSGLSSRSLEAGIRETDELVISFLAYSIKGEECYPAPLDVVEPKEKPRSQVELENDDKEYEAFPLPVSALPPDAITSANQKVFPRFQKDNFEAVEPIEKGFLSRATLESYLRNSTQPIKVKKLKDHLELEAKTGIKRNNQTNSTGGEAGELYRVGMRRPSDIKFLVQWSMQSETTENPVLSSLVRFGAEGKVAEAVPYRRRIWDGPKSISTQKIKVYLARLSYFITRLAISNRIKKSKRELLRQESVIYLK